jgi:hypothetical protein
MSKIADVCCTVGGIALGFVRCSFGCPAPVVLPALGYT